MEAITIVLSRVLAFFETVDVAPPGGLFFPDVVREVTQLMSFQKFPRSFDDWNAEDGAQFFAGKWGKIVVDRLVFYNDGVLLETKAGTDESKRISLEILDWSREKLGTTFKPEIIREWAYVNNLTFRSNVPLLVTGPLERLTKGINEEIAKFLLQPTIYEPTGINLAHDQLLRKHGRASFTIQRRSGVPFTDNKYYSEAPLPTAAHLALLEQYEKDVAEMLNPRLLASRS